MSADRVRAALVTAIPDIEQGLVLTVDGLATIIDVAATEIALQVAEGER